VALALAAASTFGDMPGRHSSIRPTPKLTPKSSAASTPAINVNPE
jgi:hypothetical protein